MSEKFIVETSARHLHVTEQDLETLFGKGAKLHYKKELSQPGQYACEEKVTVVGPKSSIKMSIIGPCRTKTQIEVAYTDARALGLNPAPPCRESGDVAGSAPCKLVGPAGEVELTEGVIAAKRHIHLDPETAAKIGVKDKDIVKVKLDCPGRALVFGDCVARVNPAYRPAMHIDTDEANAAGCTGEVWGEVVQ